MGKTYKFKTAKCGHPSNRTKNECDMCYTQKFRIKQKHKMETKMENHQKSYPQVILAMANEYADSKKIRHKGIKNQIIEAYADALLYSTTTPLAIDAFYKQKGAEEVDRMNKHKALDIQTIQEEVCSYMNVHFSLAMKTKRRMADLVQARHVSMYICWSTNRWTLQHIGLEHGGLDHSTVIHAVEKIAGYLELGCYDDITIAIKSIFKNLKEKGIL